MHKKTLKSKILRVSRHGTRSKARLMCLKCPTCYAQSCRAENSLLSSLLTPAPRHSQRHRELILRLPFPSCSRRTARKCFPRFSMCSGWKSSYMCLVGAQTLCVSVGYRVLSLSVTQQIWGSSIWRATFLVFQENMTTKTFWVLSIFAIWERHFATGAWAAELQGHAAQPLSGAWHSQDRQAQPSTHAETTLCKKIGCSLLIRAIWKTGKVNLTPIDPTGNQAAKFHLLRGRSSCKPNPSLCTDSSVQGYESEERDTEIRLRIQTVNAKCKALNKKPMPEGRGDFQTHPHLQLSTSHACTPDSQCFNPCI